MQNSYTQAAETEADDFALQWMGRMGKDPKHFASIILKLTEAELDENSEEEAGSYFSSDHNSRERAWKALEALRR